MTHTRDTFEPRAYDTPAQGGYSHDLIAADRDAVHNSAQPRQSYSATDYVLAGLFWACIIGALLLGTEQFWGPFIGWRP